MLFTKTLSLAACAFSALAVAQTNPVKITSTVNLGLRRSTNTESVRDLGYQGSIGSYFVNTFGDGVGCTDQTNGSTCGCAYITARDGGASQGTNPLQYTDLNPEVLNGLCKNTQQMGPFCPILSGEDSSSGLGITNVIQVNSTTGLLLTRPTFKNQGSNSYSPGAGLAVVDISSGKAVCTRPFGISSFGATEPYYGQLSTVIANGYIYAYANGANFNGHTYNTTVLARVPQAKAFDVTAYQYFHGISSGQPVFNSNKIYIDKLTATSPELLQQGSGNLEVSQGHVYYSPYYSQYLMFDSYIGSTSVRTAANPWGPWSPSTGVYSPPTTKNGIIYSPNVQTKFGPASGKWILLTFTDSNTLPVVNITFT